MIIKFLNKSIVFVLFVRFLFIYELMNCCLKKVFVDVLNVLLKKILSLFKNGFGLDFFFMKLNKYI